MPTQIKICGLKTADAVLAAVRAGADFLGFVFYLPSPRNVMSQQAVTLCEDVPSHVKKVAVTVDANDKLLKEIIDTLKPDYIQLHGKESPVRAAEIKKTFGIKIIKALPVANAEDLQAARDYEACADMLMFDAFSSPRRKTAGRETLDERTLTLSPHFNPPLKAEEMFGGSGKTFDWKLLKDFSSPLPWFLSGGLTSENVTDAIKQTRAVYVDVSSGVESSAGVKDTGLITQFIQAVKQL